MIGTKLIYWGLWLNGNALKSKKINAFHADYLFKQCREVSLANMQIYIDGPNFNLRGDKNNLKSLKLDGSNTFTQAPGS